MTRVVDGDTLELAGVGRVRLIGVDTPELSGDCYAREASRFTRARLAGETVRYRLGQERRDRYGRWLAYLYVDGKLFNLSLVRRGYARVLTIPPNDRYRDRFGAAARRARRRSRGLWGACRGAVSDRDCSDFRSRREAQRYFESRGGPTADPDRLDADGDGRACDSLP